MAHRTEIVDLGWSHFCHQAEQSATIRQVAIVQMQTSTGLVRILVQVIDALGVKRRGPALDTVDLVAFPQQQLGEI